jgi:hypothetical protein
LGCVACAAILAIVGWLEGRQAMVRTAMGGAVLGLVGLSLSHLLRKDGEWKRFK